MVLEIYIVHGVSGRTKPKQIQTVVGTGARPIAKRSGLGGQARPEIKQTLSILLYRRNKYIYIYIVCWEEINK